MEHDYDECSFFYCGLLAWLGLQQRFEDSSRLVVLEIIQLELAQRHHQMVHLQLLLPKIGPLAWAFLSLQQAPPSALLEQLQIVLLSLL